MLCVVMSCYLSIIEQIALSNIKMGSGWLRHHCHHCISSGLRFGKNVFLGDETSPEIPVAPGLASTVTSFLLSNYLHCVTWLKPPFIHLLIPKKY